MSDLAPTVTLSHGAAMPRLGLGTSPMNDNDAERAVVHALEVGYRLVDTAEAYRNEVGVGRALKASGVPREELFVTTKFNKRWHSVEGAKTAYDASTSKLSLDYIDLLLIHWPNPAQDRYVEAWKGLIALLDGGQVRAIGTSNFKPAHLQRLIDETGVTPDVNQIQLSPLWTKQEARDSTLSTASSPRRGALSAGAATSSSTQALWGQPRLTARRLLRWCCAGMFSKASCRSRSQRTPSG
jgi:2,5-diketo-D-gluconate reductase A